MKCWLCPCRVENSNEIDGYQPYGCFYGDDYLDDYCYEDKDGDCCCDKTKEEIEVPYNKGDEWHVCGEEYQEQENKEDD